MAVLRTVANVAAELVQAVQEFYEKLFDLEVVMDHGWIVTLTSDQTATVQLRI